MLRTIGKFIVGTFSSAFSWMKHALATRTIIGSGILILCTLALFAAGISSAYGMIDALRHRNISAGLLFLAGTVCFLLCAFGLAIYTVSGKSIL